MPDLLELSPDNVVFLNERAPLLCEDQSLGWLSSLSHSSVISLAVDSTQRADTSNKRMIGRPGLARLPTEAARVTTVEQRVRLSGWFVPNMLSAWIRNM